jgi:elongation factor Tu
MKVNVGTIGHVDHGKTTLTAALCKVLSAEAGHPVIITKQPSSKKKSSSLKDRLKAAQLKAFKKEPRHDM